MLSFHSHSQRYRASLVIIPKWLLQWCTQHSRETILPIIIFTRKAKTIYMSINILLKFILSTSVQCSTTEGFQFNLWPLQASLLPLRAMVSCISRTRDFWLKISAKRCGLYTSFYGNFFLSATSRSNVWREQQLSTYKHSGIVPSTFSCSFIWH